jgi:general secretion pathway protein I
VAEPAGPRRERGFTLVEVLVALAVLGIVLGTVYRIYGSGTLGVTRGAEELRLALVADGILERAMLDLDPRPGPLEGELPGGLAWRLSAVPFEPARQAAGPASEPRQPAQVAVRLWEVRVLVADGHGASFALHTLRLASAQ